MYITKAAYLIHTHASIAIFGKVTASQCGYRREVSDWLEDCLMMNSFTLCIHSGKGNRQDSTRKQTGWRLIREKDSISGTGGSGSAQIWYINVNRI